MSRNLNRVPNQKNIYPDAHYGPLGQQHALYAKPRHIGGKADNDMQSRLIFWGILITTILAALLIGFMAWFGRGRFLD